MITDGTSGVGKGTVSYTVAANTSTNVLTGSITIGGETFTVTQPGAK
jgi:cytidylate kinase